jgi:hypothetical protein
MFGNLQRICKAPNHGIGEGINEQPDQVITYAGEVIEIVKE